MKLNLKRQPIYCIYQPDSLLLVFSYNSLTKINELLKETAESYYVKKANKQWK